MRDDLRIQCGSPEHGDATSLAYLAIVLYPVGIPLLYLLLLRSARGAITMDRPTHLSSALSFLHRDFEARMLSLTLTPTLSLSPNPYPKPNPYPNPYTNPYPYPTPNPYPSPGGTRPMSCGSRYARPTSSCRCR